jgi:hypothetical protein
MINDRWIANYWEASYDPGVCLDGQRKAPITSVKLSNVQVGIRTRDLSNAVRSATAWTNIPTDSSCYCIDILMKVLTWNWNSKDPLFEMKIHVDIRVDIENPENFIAAIWTYSILVYRVLSGNYLKTRLEQLFFERRRSRSSVDINILSTYNRGDVTGSSI